MRKPDGRSKNKPPSQLRHGMARTSTYQSWRNMKKRCLNPNHPGYERYGGRGIKFCKRWEVFDNFLADLGEKPDGYSLERRDPNKNYTKKNCCWIPKGEQARNTTITVRAYGRLLVDVCRERNIPYGTISSRMSYLGVSAEEALEMPHRPHRRKRSRK